MDDRFCPLDVLDASFRLLAAGPRPLAVHASRLAAGLPDRPVPVGELRVLLLHPATSTAARNAVWAELVRRARADGGDPAWTVALCGIALPGLRRAAGALAAGYRGDPADLQAEVLTGFLAELRALDLDDLESVPLASRLCWAARRAGEKLARADAGWNARRRDLAGHDKAPDRDGGRAPDFVLAAAVRHEILTQAQAELIGRSRLEGVPLRVIAAETGDQPHRLVQPAETSRDHPRRRHRRRPPGRLNLHGPREKQGPEPDFSRRRGSPAPGHSPGGLARAGAAAFRPHPAYPLPEGGQVPRSPHGPPRTPPDRSSPGGTLRLIPAPAGPADETARRCARDAGGRGPGRPGRRAPGRAWAGARAGPAPRVAGGRGGR